MRRGRDMRIAREPFMDRRHRWRSTAYARGVLALVAALITAAPLHAGEAARGRVIEVVGEARVEARADLVQIDFGVVADAENAAAAAHESGERMKRVIAALRAIAEEAAIHTGTYSIRPLYSGAREQGAPKITGFVASNVVHVRSRALDRVGEMIDAATRAGANQVQRLAFTLNDDTAPRKEALGRAASQAREKAQVLAAALGLRLGAVRSVTEHELGTVRPLARNAAVLHAESAPVTPIEPGTVEVRARVALAVEIDATAGAPAGLERESKTAR